MDASRRQGLNAGDLVAFVRVDDTGGGGARPMRVLCESREDEGGEERATWALVEDGEDEYEAEESPWERDRACWLEVVRKENWIGFRSATAGGRYASVGCSSTNSTARTSYNSKVETSSSKESVSQSLPHDEREEQLLAFGDKRY